MAKGCKIIIAEYFTAITAFQTADNAVRAHCGNGFSRHIPVEDYLRESKILEVIEGTSLYQQMVISLDRHRRFGYC